MMKIKVTKNNEHSFEGIALEFHETIFIDRQGGMIERWHIFEGQKIWGWHKNLPVDEEIEVQRLVAKSSLGIVGHPEGQLVL
jgi:hypothetical protein